MVESLPSKRAVIVDAPEVSDFSAKFVYNFFTRDERENDSGTQTLSGLVEKPIDNLNSVVLESINFNRFTPRFVKLQWRPVPYGNRPNLGNTISISRNINKIHSEETFISDEYSNIAFQDNGQDQKLQYFIRRQLRELINNQNNISGTVSLVAEATRKQMINGSQLDIVKYLNENTSKEIEGSFLMEVFAQLRNNGILFLKNNADQNFDATSSQFASKLNGVKIKAQLNNKFINTILQTATNNVTSLFQDELEPLMKQTERLQETARSQQDSSMMNGSDYDFEFYDFIDFRSGIDPNSFDSTVQVVGYVIEKTEYTPDGVAIVKEPVIVENPYASTTADLKAKYGTTYGYKIKSIVYVEIAVEDSEYNSIAALSFLVASKPSQEVLVQAEEYFAPPPVSDFKVAWDFSKKAIRLTWAFPPNPQRDIKYFQVFRRRKIEEPFELIRMFDFNDATIPTVLPETPNPELVEKLNSPKSYFLDPEFTKDSKFIYAICAVDAHGYSSNYSIQFECTFDRFANRVLVKAISLAGAPKAYPNAFLLRDTFVDTIRDSGHKSLDIVFNPEYMSVIDNDDNDLGLLKMSEDSVYKLQFINVDLQTQQTIDINLREQIKKT